MGQRMVKVTSKDAQVSICAEALPLFVESLSCRFIPTALPSLWAIYKVREG